MQELYQTNQNYTRTATKSTYLSTPCFAKGFTNLFADRLTCWNSTSREDTKHLISLRMNATPKGLRMKITPKRRHWTNHSPQSTSCKKAEEKFQRGSKMVKTSASLDSLTPTN